MLEERERAYKQELADGAAEQLPRGEEIRVLALAQTRTHPWLQTLPLVVGLVMLIAGLAGLGPAWVEVIGALLILVGVAGMSLVPKRLLVRTDEQLHVFALPRSQKAGMEAPLQSVAVAELTERVDSGRYPKLDGRRLWPSYGIGQERAAIAAALDPDPSPR